MKKEILFKRGAALVTSVALLLGALSGCSFGKKDGSSLMDDAVSGSKEFVFKGEKLDLIDESDYSNLSIVGDRIYAATYSNGENVTISSFNSDGSDLKTMKIPESDQESHGEFTYDKDGNMYCILYKYYYTDQNGQIVTYDNDPDEVHEDTDPEAQNDDPEAPTDDAETDTEDVNPEIEENTIIVDGPEGMGDDDTDYHEEQYLMKYDASGNEVFKIMLDDGQDEENYYSLYGMVYDEKNGLIISCNKGIQKFNEADQSFETIVDTTDSSSQFYENSISLYTGFGGTIFASVWGQNGIELRTFDPETGKFGEPSEQFKTYDDYAFFGGNGYDLYVSKADGFYGYDKAKDTLTKLLDYVDSDLNISYAISTVVAISDNEFIANISDEAYNYALYRLTKVPADQVKEKTVITLAGRGIDYNVREFVYKFNQSNDEFKIKIVDYSTLDSDEDWNAGISQFNMDIVSGNVPDIMCFVNDEPVDSYINKGLFLDLTPYLQNDPELKDVKFVENAFDAFKTGDKMYLLVPSFYVNSVAAKTSNLAGKENLTIKECRDMIQQKGVTPSDAFGMTSKEYIIYTGLMTSGNRFINWENKSCNFNSDEFIELLEFANEFPTEITDDMWMDYDESCYRTGDALFSITYLNGFRSYRRYVDGTFGEDIKLIGFPNNLGINCSIMSPNITFAVSSHSQYADECWQLLRNFLLDEYQDQIEYDFPIRKDKFDELAKKSMEKEFWIDDDGKKHEEEEYYWVGDTQITVQPLNQEDVDVVKDFIESLTLVYTPNENVYNIVNEEASAYFSGQKTAEEVAEIIQSRLTIYVNENS